MFVLAACAGSPPGDPLAVRGDLLAIEDLPILRAGVETHQFCTYDRAGDNYDWNYFVLYTEPDGEVVIFDATGPGCLYRQQMNVWRSMGPYRADFKDVRIRYYFDGEEKPRVDMDISVFFSEDNPLGPAIEDGGVSFTGSSEFTVKIDPANRGVRLRRRLDKSVNLQQANVYVDGRRIEERPWYTVDHDKTYRDIRWVDSDFEIPAKYTRGKRRITLKIENAKGTGKPWNEFRYWVFSDKD